MFSFDEFKVFQSEFQHALEKIFPKSQELLSVDARIKHIRAECANSSSPLKYFRTSLRWKACFQKERELAGNKEPEIVTRTFNKFIELKILCLFAQATDPEKRLVVDKTVVHLLLALTGEFNNFVTWLNVNRDNFDYLFVASDLSLDDLAHLSEEKKTMLVSRREEFERLLFIPGASLTQLIKLDSEHLRDLLDNSKVISDKASVAPLVGGEPRFIINGEDLLPDNRAWLDFVLQHVDRELSPALIEKSTFLNFCKKNAATINYFLSKGAINKATLIVIKKKESLLDWPLAHPEEFIAFDHKLQICMLQATNTSHCDWVFQYQVVLLELLSSPHNYELNAVMSLNELYQYRLIAIHTKLNECDDASVSDQRNRLHAGIHPGGEFIDLERLCDELGVPQSREEELEEKQQIKPQKVNINWILAAVLTGVAGAAATSVISALPAILSAAALAATPVGWIIALAAVLGAATIAAAAFFIVKAVASKKTLLAGAITSPTSHSLRA